MKLTKILFASIAITIFMTIVGMITCGGFFNWVYKLEPTNVWKPMSGGPAPIFYVTEFILNSIFVIVYCLFSKGIPGSNKFLKGFIYGLAIFSVGMLPGMFATYFFQTINPVVVIYWTIWGAITSPLKGMIASSICE